MKRWLRSSVVLGAVALAMPVLGQEEKTEKQPAPAQKKEAAKLKTFKEKFSYAVGIKVAQDLSRQGLDIDPAIFVEALADVMGKKPLALADSDIQEVFQEFQVQRAAEAKAKSAKAKAAGAKFLEDNAKKEGIKTTKSGLQYKVIRTGKGATPTLTDKVSAHYKGRLIDGTQFDASYAGDEPTKAEKPADFPVRGVIPGWTEALQLMKVGDKWQIYLPSELAYGEDGAGADIPPHSTLIFDIELVGVIGK